MLVSLATVFSLTRNVRTRLNHLKAAKDRSQLENIDKKFRERARNRFRTPQQSTYSGTRLLVNKNVVTNPSEVCAAWATHFESLGTSKLPESAPLQDLQSRLTYYQSTSLQNEDSVLESEIDIMEIDTEIGKLKQGKSPVPDGILPEHIIHSGPIFKLWLKKIFNYIDPNNFQTPPLFQSTKEKGETQCKLKITGASHLHLLLESSLSVLY